MFSWAYLFVGSLNLDSNIFYPIMVIVSKNMSIPSQSSSLYHFYCVLYS